MLFVWSFNAVLFWKNSDSFIVVLQVKGMVTDFGDDMQCQFLEIIRTLLDSYASGSQVP